MLFQNSLYATATGRLLLAYLPEAELERFISTCGLPGPVWPNADSKEKLLRELQSICKREMAMLFTVSGLVFIAVPVKNGETSIVALGVSMAKSDFTEDKKKLIPAEMKKAAEEISVNLLSRTAFEKK